MRKFTKYTILILGVILLLLLLLCLVVQNSHVKKKLAEIGLSKLNQSINGEISIGAVHGNIVSTLVLDSVLVKDNSDSIIFVEQIRIEYRLLSLLQKKIEVNKLILEKPETFISNQQNYWNIANVFKSSKPKSTKVSKPFDYSIYANSIELKSLSAKCITNSKFIPSELESLNLNASGSYVQKQLSINLKHLDLETVNPDYHINNLSFIGAYGNDGYSLDSLFLKTNYNLINLNGNYKAKRDYKIELNSDSVNVSEFEFLLPSLYFNTLPKLKFDARFIDAKLHVNIDLNQEKEHITIAAIFDNDTTLSNSKFDISTDFQNVKPSNWGIENDLPILVNGAANFKGQGFNFKKSPLHYAFNIKNSSAYGYSIKELDAKGEFQYSKVYSNISITDPKLKMDGDVSLTSLRDSNNYELNINADYFNGNAFDNENLKGIKGALDLDLKGNGFNLDSLTSIVHIKSDSIELKEVIFDTLSTGLRISNATVFVDSFFISNPDLQISTAGNYELNEKRIDARFNTQLNELGTLYPILKDSSITLNLDADGEVNGIIDSLNVALNYQLVNTKRENIFIDTIRGEANLSISDTLLAKSSLLATNIAVDNIIVDSLNAFFDYKKDELFTKLEAVKSDTFKLNVESSVLLDSLIQINVPHLSLKTPLFEMENKNTSMSVKIDSTYIETKDVAFKSSDNAKYELSLDGYFNSKGYSNLNFRIDSLHLDIIEQLFGISKIGGVLNYEAKLEGEGDNPVFSSLLTVDNAQYDWLKPNLMEMDLSIKDHMLESKFLLLDLGNDTLEADMSFPVKLNFKENEIGVADTFNLKGNVISSKINLEEYTYNNDFGILIDGDAIIDFDIGGTNIKPTYSGYLSLIDGLFKMDAYGINYHNIYATITANNSNFSVDSLNVKTGNGYLKAYGGSQFSDSIGINKFGNIDFNIEANNFHVSTVKAHDIIIDANANLKSEKDSLVYSGQIDVVRSSFYLPDLADTQKKDKEEEPLLVQALKESEKDSVFINSQVLNTDTIDLKNNEFLSKNIFGSLKVIIPKNTWVKNDLMKLEINGDIDFVKTGRFFELFGYIQVSRGSYFLYGRRFNLEGGEINFTGGETFEPSLNLSAEYVFRGADKDVRTLTLNILGTAVEPELSFSIDGNSITESDAISYIIYNRSSDEIGYDNQKGLASAVSSGIMTKMVSSQLNKTLGNQLNLDMIELNTEDNFQSMDFVVGKYITKDLFMKYQRGFGENNNNEITPESITLEYEIIDNLFFQVQSGSSSTAGVDVTLKFEVETKWDKERNSQKEKRKGKQPEKIE